MDFWLMRVGVLGGGQAVGYRHSQQIIILLREGETKWGLENLCLRNSNQGRI
jgi:hypothetical protein